MTFERVLPPVAVYEGVFSLISVINAEHCEEIKSVSPVFWNGSVRCQEMMHITHVYPLI